MEEIRLGFGPTQQRRIRIRLAVLVALTALLAPVAFSGPLSADPAATVIALTSAVAFGAVRQLEYASEATVLTSEGVTLVTWLRRRTVPWGQITRIEARRRATRTGVPRMHAFLHVPHGAPIRVTGLVEARFGLPKQDFQGQLGVLLERWQQQTSRTEPVLVTL